METFSRLWKFLLECDLQSICLVLSPLHVDPWSQSKFVPLLFVHQLEVCAFSGCAQTSVTGRTKWPATYTQYFALGMQLTPALRHCFLSTWGAVMLGKKKKRERVLSLPYTCAFSHLLAQKGTQRGRLGTYFINKVLVHLW